MGTATGMAPFTEVMERRVQAVTTIGNDAENSLGKAKWAGTVTSVEYVPDAAKAGADTHSRTLNLFNRLGDGSGVTLIATLALVAGVNLVAYDAKAITLSGTPANLNVAAGDELCWESLHIGNGITDPGGLVRVTLGRD